MNSIGGPSGSLVYAKSWRRALLIALMLSWGMMQLIALVIERRTDLLHPSTQYKSFFYGDLICLPGLTLVFWKMSRGLPGGSHYWKSGWWHLLCLGAGIVVGLTFHFVLDKPAYTASALSSPTKLWHDLIVYPAYVYLLFSAGVPSVLHSKWGLVHGLFRNGEGASLTLLFLVLTIAFLGLLGYDGSHKASKAHVDFSWSHFRTTSVGHR